jgi:hypothetical protein
MNMFGLSPSVGTAHIACYWKFFLSHYIEVLCQYRLCKVDHANLTYLVIRQLNHLKVRMLDLHRSPASRRRRMKGNPVSGGITGSSCSWGMKILGPGAPDWGSLESETVKIWSRFLRDSDPRMTALAMTSSNCKRMTVRVQLRKLMIVRLKGLCAKMNRLVVNRQS